MKNKLYAMPLTILTLFFATFAYCFAQAGNYNGICVKAQDYAQENRLGVWSDSRFQERPWLYRHRIQ